MENYSIYYLTDNSNEIRYIGLTCRKLKTRLSIHLNDKRHNPHKNNWIKKNKDCIRIVEIENDLFLDDAKTAEMHYISLLKNLGANLLNATQGGDCSPNKGKTPKNKGVFKYSNEIIEKIQKDYIPNVFGTIKLSKKYNIPTSSVERYLKITL
jgi:predicted GIY-YIG superfamily endonuclease